MQIDRLLTHGHSLEDAVQRQRQDDEHVPYRRQDTPLPENREGVLLHSVYKTPGICQKMTPHIDTFRALPVQGSAKEWSLG